MGFAEQNIANSFAFAQKLVRAKDIQEVMALQQEYLQSQMKAMSEQAKDLGQPPARRDGWRQAEILKNLLLTVDCYGLSNIFVQCNNSVASHNVRCYIGVIGSFCGSW